MLPERSNLSRVPDVTKTGVLSSICIKFSFSKRLLIKIALETPESLIGFPAAFEDLCALTEICVIVSTAAGLFRVSPTQWGPFVTFDEGQEGRLGLRSFPGLNSLIYFLGVVLKHDFMSSVEDPFL